jgi:hypothetical protein
MILNGRMSLETSDLIEEPETARFFSQVERPISEPEVGKERGVAVVLGRASKLVKLRDRANAYVSSQFAGRLGRRLRRLS